MPLSNNTLNISYELTEDLYRSVWFAYYKESLPTSLAFWGTGIVVSLIAAYFFRPSPPEFLFASGLAITFSALLIYSAYSSYVDYMRQSKKFLKMTSADLRFVNMRFDDQSDGFDFICGKDRSHISWDSISGFLETDKYLVMKYHEQMFCIPKTSFTSEAEINFLRNLLTYNLEKKDLSLGE